MKTSYLYLPLCLFLATACHSEHDEHGTENKESAAHEHAYNEIHFSDAQAKAAGLQIDTIAPGDFHHVIKTSGQILSAPGDETTLAATANGIVSFVGRSANEGQAVGKGQTVAYISSRKISGGDPAAIAQAEYQAAEAEYKRASELVKDRIISAKEYEQARLRYSNARTAYEALSAQTTPQGTALQSPIGGYIKSRLVQEGEYVSIGQPIAVVSQNKRLQLRAEVSESYYTQLKGISTAHFTTADGSQTYRLSDLNGRLLSYGRSSDQNNYFIPVLFEFDNIGTFLPGAFAEIYLLTAPRKNILSIPLSALTEEQGLYYAYIHEKDDIYLKQEVIPGESDGQRIEILSGLKAGDRVVVQGTYQVKLAANATAVPEGHSH